MFPSDGMVTVQALYARASATAAGEEDPFKVAVLWYTKGISVGLACCGGGRGR